MADEKQQAEAVAEEVSEASKHHQESTDVQMSSLRDETDELLKTVDDMTAVSESSAAAADVINVICV